MQNKRYKIKLTTKSPIFIGSGEVLGQLNYFHSGNNIVKILDENKFCNVLTKEQISTYADYCLGGNGSLLNYLKTNKLQLGDIYKYEIKLQKTSSLNEISTFIKTAGQPYIPGSSLKGAIRTALFGYELSQNGDIKDIDKQLYGTPENNKFSKLQISDSDPVDFDKLYITQKLDLAGHKIGNDKEWNALPTYFEFIKPETEFTFTLNLVDDTFNMEQIQDALEYFTNKRIEIIQRLTNKSSQSIKNMTDTNLYFAGQSGFFNKSVLYDMSDDWLDEVSSVLHNKFDIKKNKFGEFEEKRDTHKHDTIDKQVGISPHCVKIAQYKTQLYPIGFAKLEFEEIC